MFSFLAVFSVQGASVSVMPYPEGVVVAVSTGDLIPIFAVTSAVRGATSPATVQTCIGTDVRVDTASTAGMVAQLG